MAAHDGAKRVPKIARNQCPKFAKCAELRAETEEEGRIALIQSDIWIGFPRAEQVLDRLQGC